MLERDAETGYLAGDDTAFVFGNSIDLDRVFVSRKDIANEITFWEQDAITRNQDSHAFVTTNLINIDVDDAIEIDDEGTLGVDRATFIHELTHVRRQRLRDFLFLNRTTASGWSPIPDTQILAMMMRHAVSRSDTNLFRNAAALVLIVASIWHAPAFAQEGSSDTASMMAKDEDSVSETSANRERRPLSARVIERFGMPPEVPNGPLDADVAEAVDILFGDRMKDGRWSPEQSEALGIIGGSMDARLAWLVSDLMRIASSRDLMSDLADAATGLLGIDFPDTNLWGRTTDHLIAWDIPEPPEYIGYKRSVYTLIEPTWEQLFVEGDIDWRHVSWGGVRIDDRPYDTTDESCNCIPAADNPPVSSAAEAEWLDDNAIVFGLTINGESRAYPRRIMEVREMVNDTLGGRDLGIPYCTLCGAAQAYFTDRLPDGVDRPILRTSGLLIRSNKVMYDLTTWSVFDTFRGQAVTGPLSELGVKLEQAGVVTTRWGEWKREHPETTVLVEALALGRDFDFRNKRDANGPIFPIGDVDPRLPVQEDIVGLIAASGTPIAFHREQAAEALRNGKEVAFENIRLVLDGGGVRAIDSAGEDLGSHQAFWFAWSQFHPGTQLWVAQELEK